MSSPCTQEKAIDLIAAHVVRIEGKVDVLVADKWKRVGRVSVISALVGALSGTIAVIAKTIMEKIS